MKRVVHLHSFDSSSDANLCVWISLLGGDHNQVHYGTTPDRRAKPNAQNKMKVSRIYFIVTSFCIVLSCLT